MNGLTKALLIIGIMAAIIGAIGLPDAITLWTDDASGLDSLTPGSIEEGDVFRGEVPVSVDLIAEEVTVKKYGFVKIGETKTPFYLVKLENGYALANVTFAKKQEAFKELTRDSHSYYRGGSGDKPEGVEITAVSERMPANLKEYLKDYCESGGLTEQEYSEMVENTYCLRTINYDYAKYTPPICFGVAGLCAIIIVIGKLTGSKAVSI